MNTLQTRDFPDWLGPMLVKELRQGLKARAFELTFITLQVILAIVVAYHALLYAKEGPGFDADGLNGTFWFIVGLQLLAITPLRALGGLANERKASTLELIFMTGLSSWRIAWGKWVSLFFQTVLFVLAVLPYGVLRYFFGGVNLGDDFVILGSMLLASAVLSALALAISGMPGFVRVGAIIFFGLFGMSFVQGMLMYAMVGRGGGPFSGGFGLETAWALLVFDAVLICIGALAVGASSIAPVAENHALLQRLLVLAAWVPLPVMKLMSLPESVIGVQAVFFVCLGLASTWFHLAVQPSPMRVHMEPFATKGRITQYAGFLFQPGWPGAVLFLILVEAIFIGTIPWAATGDDIVKIMAVVIMAGAALMTPPLIWRVFRFRTKQTLILHALVLVLCGGLALVVNALTDTPLGRQFLTALLPPFGFFAMLDDGFDFGWSEGWLMTSIVAFSLQALLLLRLSVGYWSQLLEHGRSIRSTRKSVPIPLEVAA